MKIGLFFGSFNPIHVGHLIIANHMANNTDLNEVWMVVSPQNPFKKNNNLIHEFDRYEMVKLAVQDNLKLKVSDIEFNLPKPNYTIDTLTLLQERNPQVKFVLIIGEDNLAAFPNWKNYEKILDYFELYVYPRPNAALSSLKEHHKIKFIPAPLLDISATFIRKAIKNNQSIKYLIPETVEHFIYKNSLYK